MRAVDYTGAYDDISMFDMTIDNNVGDFRWARRRAWIHALVMPGTQQRQTQDNLDDTSVLLLDKRLVQSRHYLLCSVIAGAVVPFLSDCCEEPACPSLRALNA